MLMLCLWLSFAIVTNMQLITTDPRFYNSTIGKIKQVFINTGSDTDCVESPFGINRRALFDYICLYFNVKHPCRIKSISSHPYTKFTTPSKKKIDYIITFTIEITFSIC